MLNNRRHFFKKSAALGMDLIAAGQAKAFAEDHVPDTSNDIFQVIRHRRSVRKFKNTPVPKDHIIKILDAANFAPTPRNRQAWKFLVIQDREILDKIKETCIDGKEERRQYYEDYLSAPVYVIVLADTETPNAENDVIAGSLAALNLMLAARALGYGTVFCVNSIPEQVTKIILNIPDRYKRICITPIGIPDVWPDVHDKKPVEQAIAWESL